jgi:deazaflavin-dependent oxidoreductase (nitroreductase family)
MTAQTTGASRAPWWVTFFGPLTRRMLATRIPLGFNGLLTVPGRNSGVPRTTPLAIIDVAGRRWVWSPWGDVNWVRNLRAAGRATITVRGRKDEVTAVELGPEERVAFYRDVLGPLVRRDRVGAWIVQHVDKVDVDKPAEAARGRPVFELRSTA